MHYMVTRYDTHKRRDTAHDGWSFREYSVTPTTRFYLRLLGWQDPDCFHLCMRARKRSGPKGEGGMYIPMIQQSPPNQLIIRWRLHEWDMQCEKAFAL